MNSNLLLDNNLTDYGSLIGCGLIICCSLLYLIRNNYTTILPNNTEALTNQKTKALTNQKTEALTNQEIGAIVAASSLTIQNNENINALTDSDYATETDYDNISDYESTSDVDLTDLNLPHMPLFESNFESDNFIMPDVDFNVCSIQELKLFEFCSLFSKEMAEHSISEEKMMEIICTFKEEDLATN
jgi:hypothetical protein